MSKPVCVISEHDFVASIADALQYVAVYHPPSCVRALAEGYAAEDSPAPRDAIAQILINSKMAAYGRRPICQDVRSQCVREDRDGRRASTARVHPPNLSTTRWPSRSTSYGPNSSRCWRR